MLPADGASAKVWLGRAAECEEFLKAAEVVRTEESPFKLSEKVWCDDHGGPRLVVLDRSGQELDRELRPWKRPRMPVRARVATPFATDPLGRGLVTSATSFHSPFPSRFHTWVK